MRSRPRMPRGCEVIKRYDLEAVEAGLMGNPECGYIKTSDLPVESLEAAVVELSARRRDAELLAGSVDINHAARLRIIERTTRHIDQLRDLLLAIRGEVKS